MLGTTTILMPKWLWKINILLSTAFDYLTFSSETHSLNSEILARKTPQEQMKLVAENYLDKLYRYVRYSFSLQGSAAEDIVHDLFLYLPQKITKFDTSRQFEPWLYRVTHNHALNCIKKWKNSSEKEENSLEAESFVSKIQNFQGELTEEVEQAYKDALLKIALNKLSEKSRELLILYYFEYKNYEEIAEIVGVKASGIGTMLARAKKELKSVVESEPSLETALTYDLE